MDRARATHLISGGLPRDEGEQAQDVRHRGLGADCGEVNAGHEDASQAGPELAKSEPWRWEPWKGQRRGNRNILIYNLDVMHVRTREPFPRFSSPGVAGRNSDLPAGCRPATRISERGERADKDAVTLGPCVASMIRTGSRRGQAESGEKPEEIPVIEPLAAIDRSRSGSTGPAKMAQCQTAADRTLAVPSRRYSCGCRAGSHSGCQDGPGCGTVWNGPAWSAHQTDRPIASPKR